MRARGTLRRPLSAHGPGVASFLGTRSRCERRCWFAEQANHHPTILSGGYARETDRRRRAVREVPTLWALTTSLGPRKEGHSLRKSDFRR